MKMIICLLLSLSFAVATRAQAEVTVPDTSAGRQLREWLRALDTGNDQTYKQFISSHYGQSLLTENDADYRADRQARIYLDTQGFSLRDIEKSSETELVVLAQARLSELWFRLTLKVDPAPSHLITDYSAQRIPPP